MLISVCMIAYNHEAYTREAIEGVLMQQTNFDVELIISNDCSTDNTHETIQKCIDHYKGHIRIKYFNNVRNLGMMPNFIFALNQCNGNYIALCEGDDYWTDPLKLQKQIDYISRHKDCNLVFTDVKVWNEITREFLPNWANVNREKYEFKELVERNVITTCTVLFRNPNRNEEISNYLLKFKVGDYPLYLFLLRPGYAYFLNEETAVYRQHTGGVFSLNGPENFINTNIAVLNCLMNEELSKQERVYVKKSLVKWHYAKVVRFSSDGQFNKIRSYLWTNLKLSDIYYNLGCFLKSGALYLSPKMKFNSLNNSKD
ncbi:MAG: glycosyltransferase [Bacteroidota bacterium]|nr:glycosyltransferase [Bacteroidota bacterium]